MSDASNNTNQRPDKISKIALIGANGRMGRTLLSIAHEFPAVSIASAVDTQPAVMVEMHPPLKISTDVLAAISSTQAAIEFSSCQCAVELAELCGQYKRPLVIASTGFSTEQRQRIEKAAQLTPILVSANYSLGIMLLKKLLRAMPKDLAALFDIEISETHHRHKKDAPSGTALELARCLQESQTLVLDRSAHKAARSKGEIGLSSLRGGDVVGEHTVSLLGEGELLELSHRAWNRAIFARGALTALIRLLDRAPGLYSLEQLFESPLTA